MAKTVKQMEARVDKAMYQTEEIAVWAPLVTLKDKKKCLAMKRRFNVFAACMRGGGGDECVEGNYLQATIVNQLLIVNLNWAGLCGGSGDVFE